MKLFATASTLALVALVAFSSCKKNFVCSCQTVTTTTTSMTDSTGTITTVVSDTVRSSENYNTSRNDAKDRCANRSYDYVSSDSTSSPVKMVQNCDLK